MNKMVRDDFDPRNPPELTEQQRAELEALAAMPEEDIDLSDIPEWIPGPDAVRGYHWRRMSEEVELTIDADVLAWLKAEGKGYQTRLNAILREAMLKDVASKR